MPPALRHGQQKVDELGMAVHLVQPSDDWNEHLASGQRFQRRAIHASTGQVSQCPLRHRFGDIPGNLHRLAVLPSRLSHHPECPNPRAGLIGAYPR